ncbi:MAG: amidohydrolase family protein, partial [Calditrichaeota bacterium]|nr:amidohydrolase family protein [Calditrichota bacterium]
QEMRLAALIQKPRAGVTSITAQNVYDMATLGGAKALGLENKIGSFDEGKKADLIVLDLNKVHTIPADDIYSQIVYSARASEVCDVMIDGQWTVRDRKLQTINNENLKSAVWEEIGRLFDRRQHL